MTRGNIIQGKGRQKCKQLLYIHCEFWITQFAVSLCALSQLTGQRKTVYAKYMKYITKMSTFSKLLYEKYEKYNLIMHELPNIEADYDLTLKA